MASATATAPAFALASSLSRRGFLPLSRRAGRPVPQSLRFVASAVRRRRSAVVVAADAAAAAGSAEFGDEENPYELLGIRPLDSFDHMKMAYKKKRKDAEETGDDEFLAKLDRAHDTVMMQQLRYRKKGVTYGSVQVSKDIKYADNQPIVLWGPRFSRSTVKDMRINMAISAAFEYGEVEGRGIRMAKRVVRALGLIFGCVFTASLFDCPPNIFRLIQQLVTWLSFHCSILPVCFTTIRS
ncbi:uncharacterized protein [Zea mays]|uniref:J domain-containing protein n=1 Tax=Zea mays TaxID=4577 RepID=A0A804NNB4_MAIZE|nr:uncharacterized protein LOC100272810 isoform X3 [Zea mays]